jgi:hypothetical protein
MAWTTPKSWATNEVVTAANMNTHLRDNMAFVGSPPSCAVYNSASITNNNTFVVMTANTELWDTDSMHSTVSNTSRITANTAGRYQLNTTMRFGINTAGSRAISYRLNGGTDIQLAAVPAATTGVEAVLSGSVMLVLAAADYVEVASWQNSGGNLDAILQGFSLTLVTVP